MENPNPINYLIHKIHENLLEKCRDKYDKLQRRRLEDEMPSKSLIKVHHEKLRKYGEISFPANYTIWHNYLTNTQYKLRENIFAEESRAEFLASASAWTLPVLSIKMQNERCVLFLQRTVIIPKVLERVLESSATAKTSYGQLKKNPLRCVQIQAMIENYDDNDLSLFRAKLMTQTLRRLLEYSEYTLKTESNDEMTNNDKLTNDLNLIVHSIAAKGAQPKLHKLRTITLKCGIVTDPTTGKLAKMETPEYLSLRSTDLRLMAMHKYGIRAKNDQRFCELMERLGAAAVTVDLLEVKHTSPVQIIRNGQGSTKGASFILYNSARLETLLRTFDERVEQQVYQPLPDMKDVDLTLLKEEEEWQLIYGYIFAFPNLIEHCLEQLESGLCATHLIIRFLSEFVALFSIYYRRIRILTETRDHLMPYVYARIYLIKAVRQILNKTLALLDIEPVLFM